MFWIFRVLGFYLTITIFTITFMLVSYLPLRFGNRKIKHIFAMIFSHTFIWLTKVVGGLRYKISGLDKLPKTTAVVLVNHQSFWDNVFFQTIIPECSWVMKKELFKIPFLGWGLKLVDPIAVDRSDSMSVKQILREGQKKLKAGIWLVIFPEGTRLKPEETTKFKPSAVKLAVMSNVPIVLIAHNAGMYWPKGFWVKRPGEIQVKIVDVLYPETTEEKQDVRSLTEKIEHIINSEKQALYEHTKLIDNYELKR